MKKWSLLLIVGMLAVSERADAQGFIIPELGTRVNGMGAAIGRPDDVSAIYHNPGALALLPGTQVMISFGAAFIGTDIRVHPWPGSEPYLTDPVDKDGYFPEQGANVFAPIPMIGVSTNLWSEKIVGALGVYVPNAAGASFGEDSPGRYHIIDGTLFSAFFTGALAYRPLDWLAVGFGASAVYIRISRRSLFFPVLADGTDFSATLGKETELTLEGDDIKPAFNLGVQIWPHRTVSIGLMMLTRYDVALEGPLTLKLDPNSLGAGIADQLTDNRHETTIISPWIFGIGAHWDITPWLEVGAEFRLYLSSQVDEQLTKITEGELLPTFLKDGIVTPKNLHNSFHTGAGFIVRPSLPIDLELMAGFHYDNSASPDNTVEVSAPSFDLLAIHSGARWAINKRFRVALLYSHYWYFERETTDSITSPPTNFIGSGHNNQLSLVLETRFGPGIGVTPAAR